MTPKLRPPLAFADCMLSGSSARRDRYDFLVARTAIQRHVGARLGGDVEAEALGALLGRLTGAEGRKAM
jgi:hypothetical protein